jgi:hypothetical protein
VSGPFAASSPGSWPAGQDSYERGRAVPLIAVNRLLGILIVAATIAFAIGVAIERSQESGEEGGVEASQVEGESAEAGEVEGEASEAEHDADSGEKLLGIDPESVGLVIVAAIVSLGLAAAVWVRPDLRGLLLLIALAMAAFTALDLREFVHQLGESRTGLALLVAVVTVLHGGAAVLAVRQLRGLEPNPA